MDLNLLYIQIMQLKFETRELLSKVRWLRNGSVKLRPKQ